MRPKPRIFLDTSALFSGIWSAQGGARMVLKLGEAGVVQIVLSQQVLAEIDDVLRRKAPHHLPTMAIMLDRCQVETAHPPASEMLTRCQEWVSHPADALILAEAWSEGTDYLVTLDREHFLDVPGLVERLSFPMGTPGDFLAWLRLRLKEQLDR